MAKNRYAGVPPALAEALKLTYELRAKIKNRVKRDLKRSVNTKVVGHQELDGYILQCDPKAPRKRREAWWYEAAMRRLIDTVLVLRTENGALRRELGRSNRQTSDELGESDPGQGWPGDDADGDDE